MSSTTREQFGITRLTSQHKDIKRLRKQYPTSIHGNKIWKSSFILMDYFKQHPIPKDWKVLELGNETPSGFEVVEPYEPVLECELRWVIRHEHVHHLRDLSARVRLGLGADLGLQSARKAGRIFASERALSVADEREEVARFIQERWASLPPRLGKMQKLQVQYNQEHWARWLDREASSGS